MAMYLATYSLDIAALLYLLSMLRSGTALNSNRKNPFIISILLTIFIILSEAGTIMTANELSSSRIMNIVFNILGFSLSPMIPLAITLIFDSRILTSHKLLLLPTAIHIFVTLLSPVYKWIFYVDANNHYMRGSLFFIFIFVYVVNYLILVISTMDVEKKFNYPIKRKMMTLFLYTIIGTSIQLVYPSIYASWHCITLTIFLYFVMMSEFDSSFDTLSGLYNRAALDRVTKGISKAKQLTVIVLDIDDFKMINDCYGHDYGDRVIQQIAKTIRASFGRHYKCYRLGGDEFAIIGEDAEPEKIETHLKQMTKDLSDLREKGHVIPTVSYGYSFYLGEGQLDFSKVLNEADELMYQHKRSRLKA